VNFGPDNLVKTCSRIESGLRLGFDGIRACCFGILVSPLYWSAQEAAAQEITKASIIDARKRLFDALNDDHSDISCKTCLKVERKKASEVRFDQLGFIDLAHFTTCNLRCSYCGFTISGGFHPPLYDAAKILQQFSAEDVCWDSCVDFNGGEPSLLRDLDDYLQFFETRRIRVRLYSNGLRFRRVIQEALERGAIASLIVSLDAGTPSTFKRTKRSDKFSTVLENLCRYARAGERGNGALGVKYVFTRDNCGEDDIAGFVYAMLAIRPQKILLGFDFISLDARKHEGPEEIAQSFAREIDAYARTYVQFRKHGLDPAHFFSTFASSVTMQSRQLMAATMKRIDEISGSTSQDPALNLPDFRDPPVAPVREPLEVRLQGGTLRAAPNIEGDDWCPRRVVLAPATPHSVQLANVLESSGYQVTGLLDRSPGLHGRHVDGIPVIGYHAAAELPADLILITSSLHGTDILRAIAKYGPACPIGFWNDD
jgi:hypothetical protein